MISYLYFRDPSSLICTIYIYVQGPVHFDENGVRNVNMLQVLQYRTTYINGTPIMGEECNSSIRMDLRLRLVTVALFRKDEIQSNLEFLVGNRNSIWPSKK